MEKTKRGELLFSWNPNLILQNEVDYRFAHKKDFSYPKDMTRENISTILNIEKIKKEILRGSQESILKKLKDKMVKKNPHSEWEAISKNDNLKKQFTAYNPEDLIFQVLPVADEFEIYDYGNGFEIKQKKNIYLTLPKCKEGQHRDWGEGGFCKVKSGEE